MVGIARAGLYAAPVSSSWKPLATRKSSAIQTTASSPRLAPSAGRSAVRFQSFVAMSLVAGDDTSKRRTAGRLIALALLLRSVETKIPLAGSLPTSVTPSASGSPVPSG